VVWIGADEDYEDEDESTQLIEFLDIVTPGT
jgi:hypothetical protein